MKPYLLLLAGFLLPALLYAQAAIPPIPGWKMEVNKDTYRFIPPSSLNGAANFEYDIMPVEKSNGIDLGEWLKTAAAKDLQGAGYSGTSPGVLKTVNNSSDLLTYSVLTNDGSGKKLAIIYFAYVKPDHEVRYGKIVRLREYTGTYINVAANHFVAILKQEMTPGKTITPGVAPTEQKPITTAAQPTQINGSGKGLSPAEIRGIVLHRESSIGVGGMLIFVYKPYLLLKNGTLYEHPEISPYDLNVAQSRQTEPEKWGSWKLEGKTLTIIRGSKTSNNQQPNLWTSGWTWGLPAVQNEKITGSFSTISGGGNTALGGGSIVVSSKFITFNNKGQFTYESTGGGSYTDASGGVSAYSSKNSAGTYNLNGYSLELHFNNGKITRQSFYFYGDDHEVFGIGNHAYTKSK